MRSTALVAILAIAALGLAGCSGKGGGATDSSTSTSADASTSGTTSHGPTSSSGTGSRSATGTGSPAENHAPVGSIAVLVEGRNATFTLTGSDQDGDALTWDLAFGDGQVTNGTSLPANATHAYSISGNLTANFTVTDGKAPASYNVTVALAQGAKQTFTITGSTKGFDPTAGTFVPQVGACATGYSGEADPPSEVGGSFHPIDVVIDDWAWTMTAGYHVWFYDKDLTTIGDGTDSGTVPAGTAEVDLCVEDPTLAAGSDYVFLAVQP